MFTISCYTFHPLIKRFITLWRNVQVVSDWLTFFLSILCCQCGEAMPATSSESRASVEDFKVETKMVVDPGRASGEPQRAQHLLIDFTPQVKDSEETETRCQQFWEFVNNQPGLAGMMVTPADDIEPYFKEVSNVPVKKISEQNDFPAVHALRKINEKDALKTALGTAENKCH